jgi:hypothetical protein
MEALGSIEKPVTIFLVGVALKMLSLRASETSVAIFQPTQHNV